MHVLALAVRPSDAIEAVEKAVLGVARFIAFSVLPHVRAVRGVRAALPRIFPQRTIATIVIASKHITFMLKR